MPSAAGQLQCGILQSCVATDKLLYRVRIGPGPRCDFCSLCAQGTAHLIFECLDIGDFWLRLSDRLEGSGQIGVALHVGNMLFGGRGITELRDGIVMLAEWCMCRCECVDGVPCSNLFVEWMGGCSDMGVMWILDGFDVECGFGV